MGNNFIYKLTEGLAKLAKEEGLKPIDIAAGARVSLGTVYSFLKGGSVSFKVADWLSDNLPQDKVADIYINAMEER